jgi:hypothetical protein
MAISGSKKTSLIAGKGVAIFLGKNSINEERSGRWITV